MNKYRDDFRYEKLHYYLRCSLSDNAKMHIWNYYCEKSDNNDDCLYLMSDIDNFFGKGYISDFLSILSSEFHYADEYFYINGMGTVSSTDFPDSWIRYDDMLVYILRNKETFGDKQIELILNEQG